MEMILPSMPISALRSNHTKVIEELGNSPKVLTTNGYNVAVLVSPERWNQMVALINRLEDTEIIRRRSKEMKEGNYVDDDDVKAELIKRGLIDG